MKFLVTFRPNWWIIGAIFEEICIYVEENEGFGQPLIPFILLIGELQMGPYMVTYWCVSECCSLIGSHRLYVYRNGNREKGIELRTNHNRVFMSGDLGGKQSHASPQKTIKMNRIELKTSYFFKISLPYLLKLNKYEVLIAKSTFIETKLSKTLENAKNHSINMFPH